jgi:hypothetical protein
MKDSVMDGNALRKTQRGMTAQAGKPTVGGQAAQRALLAAGVIAGTVLLVGAIVAPVCAQSYPDQPIRLISSVAGWDDKRGTHYR